MQSIDSKKSLQPLSVLFFEHEYPATMLSLLYNLELYWITPGSTTRTCRTEEIELHSFCI